uniref:DUF834 domain-containing protein n=1 Tax=Oryza sativa subsp. japonica TaxID=39947 RepID=Q337T8_ORYSJ|nr:hypothetical protein LOC_Os10g30460 [Oryza sativa Japonica Group]
MDGLGERRVAGNHEEGQPEATSTATELTSRRADGVPAGDGDGEEAAKGLLVLAEPKEATAHREVVWDGSRRRQMRRRPQVGGGDGFSVVVEGRGAAARVELSMAMLTAAAAQRSGHLGGSGGRLDATGGSGGSDARWNVEVGVELDAAKPSVETAQHGGDGNGGGGRLNDASERRRLVARWGGFPVAIGENGAAAGVRQRAANAMAQAAQRGDGGSGQLEGCRRAAALGLAWGARERTRGARGGRVNGRGEHWEAFIARGGNGEAGEWRIWSGNGRRCGQHRGRSGARSRRDFRGKRGESVEQVEGNRFHSVWARGHEWEGRNRRRRGRQRAAWRLRAVVGRDGDGPDKWVPRSHLSA